MFGVGGRCRGPSLCNPASATHSMPPLTCLLPICRPFLPQPVRRLPTFLYAMPFSPTQVFLEETSLVARPIIPFPELKLRLEKRMAHLGIKVSATRVGVQGVGAGGWWEGGGWGFCHPGEKRTAHTGPRGSHAKWGGRVAWVGRHWVCRLWRSAWHTWASW